MGHFQNSICFLYHLFFCFVRSSAFWFEWDRLSTIKRLHLKRPPSLKFHLYLLWTLSYVVSPENFIVIQLSCAWLVVFLYFCIFIYFDICAICYKIVVYFLILYLVACNSFRDYCFNIVSNLSSSLWETIPRILMLINYFIDLKNVNNCSFNNGY